MSNDPDQDDERQEVCPHCGELDYPNEHECPPEEDSYGADEEHTLRCQPQVALGGAT